MIATAVVLVGSADTAAADTTASSESPAEPEEPPSTYAGPFVDDEGSVHQDGISAIWAAGITRGCEEWRYCPDDHVTRGQLATFLTRALSLPRFSGPALFVDTEANVHKSAIARLADAGITVGCNPPTNTRYCPEKAVTRGQMATFLTRGLDLPDYNGADMFSDDDDSVHQSSIQRLADAGITSGCDSQEFCPDRLITRAELATMLTRALGLPVPDPGELPTIPDEVIAEYEADLWPTDPDPEGWRPLIEQYFKPGDVQRAIDVIACESTGYRYAANPTSSARGLFQHMGRFWEERSAKAGVPGADIYDPEAQMTVAAWLVYEQGGWSAHWYPSQDCWG